MSDNNAQSAMDTMRAELSSIKEQIQKLFNNFESRKSDELSSLVDKLSKEIAQLREGANTKAQQLYDAGHAGLDEVGEHVRKNPMSSLLVAFGAGCVLSWLLRQIGK